MLIAGPQRPIDRLKAEQAHQPSRPAAPDPHPLAAKMANHLAGAVERILHEQLVDPTHQRQRLRALALRLVVERRAPDRQQPALPVQAQRRMIALHHRPTLGPAHRPDPRDKNPAPRSAPRSWREDRAPRPHDPGPGVPRPSRTARPDPRSPGASTHPPGSDGPGAERRSPEASDHPEAPQARSSLSTPRKTCGACSSAFLRQTAEYTLTTCPIFRGHLIVVGEVDQPDGMRRGRTPSGRASKNALGIVVGLHERGPAVLPGSSLSGSVTPRPELV